MESKTMKDAIIFDLDGTLADLSHRLHFISNGNRDWDSFFAACKDDAPIPHMVQLYRMLKEAKVSDTTTFSKHTLIVASGRSDSCRYDTAMWMLDNGIITKHLYMRKEGDHRSDYQVKQEILEQIKADGFNPIMAFDDRDQVVKMWRDNEVPCAQVAPGDF